MTMPAILAALSIIAPAFGQTLTFEAASVKPSSPSLNGNMINDPLTYSAHRTTLKFLIAAAYDLGDYQVSGGPDWVEADRFDIDARTAAPATQAQKMEMLRGLLMDRFQLTCHREPRTIRAYAMSVAKDGPKVHPAKEDGPSPNAKPGLLALRTTMKQLAAIVSNYLSYQSDPGDPAGTEQLPIVDQTGLAGVFDIRLEPLRVRDWFVELEQQFGLHLEPRKVPVEMLIVDKVVKPLGN
jgi:uncharacterized protein (TIGR03435 family)